MVKELDLDALETKAQLVQVPGATWNALIQRLRKAEAQEELLRAAVLDFTNRLDHKRIAQLEGVREAAEAYRAHSRRGMHPADVSTIEALDAALAAVGK